MFLRKIKNEFKEEIYKEDLISVITTSLISMILFSILLALINSVMILLFSMQSTLLLFVFGYLLAKRVRESYVNYHIIYPLISVGCFIIGLFIFNSVSVFAYNQTLEWLFFTQSLKIGLINTLNTFNPFYYISNFDINNLLYLLIILYTIFVTFRNSKKNY